MCIYVHIYTYIQTDGYISLYIPFGLLYNEVSASMYFFDGSSSKFIVTLTDFSGLFKTNNEEKITFKRIDPKFLNGQQRIPILYV